MLARTQVQSVIFLKNLFYMVSLLMTRGAYHLAQKSGNFGLNSNVKVIFRKFRSEIVEYLQSYSSFSVRNGTAEISLPFAFKSFQFPVSHQPKTITGNRIANGKGHFVRLVCWFWKNPYHYSTLVPTGLFWQMVSTPDVCIPLVT